MYWPLLAFTVNYSLWVLVMIVIKSSQHKNEYWLAAYKCVQHKHALHFTQPTDMTPGAVAVLTVNTKLFYLIGLSDARPFKCSSGQSLCTHHWANMNASGQQLEQSHTSSSFDVSHVLVAIQLRFIYWIELLYQSFKTNSQRVFTSCTDSLYQTYAQSSLYYYVFKFKTYFLNNTTRRKRLLEWLQRKLTAPLRPTNFTTDWRDGVLLCALCEVIVPGCCPRFDLLNPDKPNNNLKLALNLIRTYLRLDPDITELEIYECRNEAKLVHLLSQIKIVYTKMLIKSTGTAWLKRSRELAASEPSKHRVRYFTTMDAFFKQCTVKGMGVALGVRSRRARFAIYYGPSPPKFSFIVEVVGPNESLCSEHVHIDYTQEIDTHNQIQEQNYDQIMQNLVMRAAMKTKAQDTNLKIPIFYEQMEDHVVITYIPLFSGKHQIGIVWQGRYIFKSPFYPIIEETEYLKNELTDMAPKLIPGLQYPLCLLKSEKEYNLDEMGTVIRRKVLKERIVANEREHDYVTYLKTKQSPSEICQPESQESTSQVSAPCSPLPINQSIDTPIIQVEEVGSSEISENQHNKPKESVPSKSQVVRRKTKVTTTTISINGSVRNNRQNVALPQQNQLFSKSTTSLKKLLDESNQNFEEELGVMKKQLEAKLLRYKQM